MHNNLTALHVHKVMAGLNLYCDARSNLYNYMIDKSLHNEMTGLGSHYNMTSFNLYSDMTAYMI